MKKIFILLTFILSVNLCLGTIVYLRKGGTIEGEVISKDDEKFVLKTAEGEKTIKWRQVKNKSIKEMNPVLYETLKTKAIERQKKKKEAESKKNIDKKEKIIQPVFLSVKINKERGRFKKISNKELFKDSKARTKRKWNMVKFLKRERFEKIKIKISGLAPKKTYSLKTVYSHYLEKYGKDGRLFKQIPSLKNVEKISQLNGEENYEIIIQTPFYYQYKEKITDPDYHFRKGQGRQKEYGHKSKGVDISIWLDDKLLYEKKKGKIEKYYENAKKL
jgi:hypothetical protein